VVLQHHDLRANIFGWNRVTDKPKSCLLYPQIWWTLSSTANTNCMPAHGSRGRSSDCKCPASV